MGLSTTEEDHMEIGSPWWWAIFAGSATSAAVSGLWLTLAMFCAANLVAAALEE
jgi:hypothetical protein